MKDSRNRRGEYGFTVLDFAMTLVVFSLLALLTVHAVVETVDTYRRKMAMQYVMAQIRSTQSLAVTRSDVFGFHWGGDDGSSRLESEFRIVRDTTGSCDLPDPTAPVDGTDVIRGWKDMSNDFRGVRIQSMHDDSDKQVAALMFDSIGSSVNTCESVSFPVTVVLADRYGRTAELEVKRSGIARSK